MVTRLDYTPQGGRQFEALQSSITGAGRAGLNSGLAIKVALTTTAQDVSHGLGRAYSGWFLVDTDAPTMPSVAGGGDTSKFISIKGSAAANVTVWVY